MRNGFVVFDVDRAGIFADVTTSLAGAGINIDTILGSSLKGFGFIYIESDDDNKALKALSDTSLQALDASLPLLIMKDEAGALGKIAQKFHDEEIVVDAIRFLKRNKDSGFALVSIKVERSPVVDNIIGDFLVERQIDLR